MSVGAFQFVLTLIIGGFVLVALHWAFTKWDPSPDETERRSKAALMKEIRRHD